MPRDRENWAEFVSREDLKREITLDAYVADQLSEMGDSKHNPEVRERLEAFVRELEPLARPEDVWWEWVEGTEPLMQTGGLALVRNGQIVWATMTWIS